MASLHLKHFWSNSSSNSSSA